VKSLSICLAFCLIYFIALALVINFGGFPTLAMADDYDDGYDEGYECGYDEGYETGVDDGMPRYDDGKLYLSVDVDDDQYAVTLTYDPATDTFRYAYEKEDSP